MRAAISPTILACALLLTPPAAPATAYDVDPDSPNDGPGADPWRSLNIYLSAYLTPHPERK